MGGDNMQNNFWKWGLMFGIVGKIYIDKGGFQKVQLNAINNVFILFIFIFLRPVYFNKVHEASN